MFTNHAVATRVSEELLQIAQSRDVEILAYCFMPDHLHYLAEGLTEEADLLQCTRLFRQRSGYQYRRLTGFHLWQEGYFDRHLRDEDATVDVIAYIVGNPVRAGLCSNLLEYPHAGASGYRLEELSSYVQWRP